MISDRRIYYFHAYNWIKKIINTEWCKCILPSWQVYVDEVGFCNLSVAEWLSVLVFDSFQYYSVGYFFLY